MEREERIPWEERSDLGLWRAFIGTLVLSIRDPNRFYALRPQDRSVWPALGYGLAFQIPVALITFAYQKLIAEDEMRRTLAGITPALREVLPQGPELIESVLSVSALGGLLMTPVSYLLELVGTAGVTWIGLRLTKGPRTSFGVLLRMFAYASWIHFFTILGVTGDVILGAISFILTLGFGSYYWLVVVKRSQGVDTRRAIYVSLVGGFVALTLGCIVGLPLLALLIFWVVSNIHLPKLS